MRICYNPEKNKTDLYEDVYIDEKVNIKGVIVPCKMHYLKDSAGEFWGDFDHPMENVHKSFDAYREKTGVLSDKKIAELCKQMSLPDLAKKTGIDVKALKNFKHNHQVPSLEEDQKLRLAFMND